MLSNESIDVGAGRERPAPALNADGSFTGPDGRPQTVGWTEDDVQVMREAAERPVRVWEAYRSGRKRLADLDALIAERSDLLGGLGEKLAALPGLSPDERDLLVDVVAAQLLRTGTDAMAAAAARSVFSVPAGDVPAGLILGLN